MVLFESSTVIHGRPTPLPGEYYANTFLYYKPTRGWDDNKVEEDLTKVFEARGMAYYRAVYDVNTGEGLAKEEL